MFEDLTVSSTLFLIKHILHSHIKNPKPTSPKTKQDITTHLKTKKNPNQYPNKSKDKLLQKIFQVKKLRPLRPVYTGVSNNSSNSSLIWRYCKVYLKTTNNISTKLLSPCPFSIGVNSILFSFQVCHQAIHMKTCLSLFPPEQDQLLQCILLVFSFFMS